MNCCKKGTTCSGFMSTVKKEPCSGEMGGEFLEKTLKHSINKFPSRILNFETLFAFSCSFYRYCSFYKYCKLMDIMGFHFYLLSYSSKLNILQKQKQDCILKILCIRRLMDWIFPSDFITFPTEREGYCPRICRDFPPQFWIASYPQ